MPSGRWQASYIGRDLVRHCAPITFTARIDAEGWLYSERKHYERPEDWQSPAAREAQKIAAAVSFEDYAQTWLEQRTLKPRTAKMYADLLRLHLNPVLALVPIDKLTPQAVRGWYSRMDEDRPRVRSHAYGLLHAIAAVAVKDGYLQSNPCHIERAMTTTRKREPVIPTITELHQIAEKIEPQQFSVLILVIGWCGLRWGEVTELRRRDIEADCSVIHVARAVTHRGECIVSTPKSNKPRVVVVPPHIRAELKAHMESHVNSGADALLFPPLMRGCHLSDRTVRDCLAPALESVNRTGMRLHDFRHAAAQFASRVGSVPEVMARMGHSTVKASQVYMSVADGRDVALAEALSVLARQETEAGHNTA